jgi:hypothetical protein
MRSLKERFIGELVSTRKDACVGGTTKPVNDSALAEPQGDYGHYDERICDTIRSR